MELGGHSGASVFISQNEAEMKTILNELLTSEGEEIYELEHHNKEHNTCYYRGDYGLMSIKIVPFKNYKDITTREFFTRTG